MRSKVRFVRPDQDAYETLAGRHLERPAINSGVTINRSLGAAEIRLPNGGHVDFWSIDYTGRAGRGRKYHRVLIDEAADDEGYLKDAFPAAMWRRRWTMAARLSRRAPLMASRPTIISGRRRI